MDLTCPKCQGTMRTYERSGITVDQCGECRGIFLDRGELERLVDAETQFHAAAAPAGGRGQPERAPEYGYPQDRPRDYRGERRYDDDDDDDRRRHSGDQYRYSDQHRYSGDPHKKRRRSFMEDLFD